MQRVAAVADVPEGEARRFPVGGVEVCLVNLGGAGFRAISPVCSHAHAFLDEGEVDMEDRTIECPRHGSTFDLDTGAARTLPATAPVDVFGVRIDGNDILVEVN